MPVIFPMELKESTCRAALLEALFSSSPQFLEATCRVSWILADVSFFIPTDKVELVRKYITIQIMKSIFRITIESSRSKVAKFLRIQIKSESISDLQTTGSPNSFHSWEKYHALHDDHCVENKLYLIFIFGAFEGQIVSREDTKHKSP